MSTTEIADQFLADHQSLVESLQVATTTLTLVGDKLERRSVHYAEHTVFAQRCASLARFLDSAQTLAREGHYSPALALIRSALEHHYFDQLLFLANRYVREVKEVDEPKWRRFEASNRVNGIWAGDITALSGSPTGE